MALDFARMIAPTRPEVFFEAAWQKEPLVIARGEPGYYTELLSLRDVDALIYFGKATFPKELTFEVAPRAETVLPGAPPLQNDGRVSTPDVPDLRGLGRLYGQGKTVYVHHVERFWQPIASLCREVEATLHHPVSAGMFLTPKHAQGLPPHFDSHDVFVMQVEGNKRWRVYRPEQPLPLQGMTIPDPTALPAPAYEIELGPGDLLYMPRGWVHEAMTTETYSLHVSIGVEVFRWIDLLRAAVDAAAQEDLRLREALPTGFFDVDPKALEGRLADLLASVAARARPTEAVDLLADRFFMSELPAIPAGSFLSQEDEVTTETVVTKSSSMVCRIHEQGDAIGIQFAGNEIRGPAKIGAALRFIASTKQRFSVRDVPGELSENAKLILVRRLVREGLLTIVRGL